MRPLLALAAAFAAGAFFFSGSDSDIEAFPDYAAFQQFGGSVQGQMATPTAQDLILMQAMMNGAAQQSMGVQRDNQWSSLVGGGNYDPVSGAGYVSVPGYGPIGHGM